MTKKITPNKVLTTARRLIKSIRRHIENREGGFPKAIKDGISSMSFLVEDEIRGLDMIVLPFSRYLDPVINEYDDEISSGKTKVLEHINELSSILESAEKFCRDEHPELESSCAKMIKEEFGDKATFIDDPKEAFGDCIWMDVNPYYFLAVVSYCITALQLHPNCKSYHICRDFIIEQIFAYTTEAVAEYRECDERLCRYYGRIEKFLEEEDMMSTIENEQGC